MSTAGDGVTSCQSGGAGGKFRKTPIRPSAQATPYDRPPTGLRNNQPSLFAKLVAPASRLIYAGADRLFGVFRKRLLPFPAQRLPGTSEEPRNGSQEAGPNSAATEISELENMLKEKTFTRSEIERLKTLLYSRTTESDVEEDRAKLPITTSQVLRLEASTSGILKEHVEERETRNLHVPISTPIINSGAFKDDVATPAELAKAYMGTRPAKLSPLSLRPSSQPPRQDPLLLNNTIILPKTPVASLAPKTAATFTTCENCLTTPRSQGRSDLYSMTRSPYFRVPSTLNQKGVVSPSAWEQQGSIGSSRMGVKRRSSVIDDYIRFSGPMRRIRQKTNLLSQQSSLSKHKSEFGSSQKLLLRNAPEPKSSTPIEENMETSNRNLGYGSVPTKSSKMASKIFEHLDRMSPKEKPSGSKLSGITEKIDSPKFLSSSQDNKKSEGQRHVWLPDARESTSQINNVLSSVNGNCTDDDNHCNGHVSISSGENKKLGTSAETVQTSALPEVDKIPSIPEPSVVNHQKMGFKFSPSTSIEKESVVSQRFGKSTNVVGPSGVKSNIIPDEKTSGSPSLINSALNNSQVKVSASNKDDSGNTQKLVYLFGKSESSSSASGLFSFGGSINTSSVTNGTLASTSSNFASSSSVQSSGSNTNKLSSSTSSHVISSATTSAASSRFPSSVAAPIFGSGSASASSPSTLAAPSKPFVSTSSATSSNNGGSIFAFSSSSATLTTNGFQANTQAVPFKFESGTSGITSTSSGSSLFSSSAPSFGLSSAATTSSTTSIFGSSFNLTPSFGLSSTTASTETKSGGSASGSAASVFGSTTLQPPLSSTFGCSTPFSSGASTSMSSAISSPLKVGSSNAGASTGSSVFSFSSKSSSPVLASGNSNPLFGTPPTNNNSGEMSMEESMATTQTSSPSGGKPGFMFGSGALTTPSTVPFQFGGQTNQTQTQTQTQPPSQNPFQASGGFLLGSGGGD